MSGAHFSDVFSEELAHCGKSQQELAQEMGISEQYLSDVKLGRRLPSVAFIEKFIKAAGLEEDRSHWHHLAAHAHGWRI